MSIIYTLSDYFDLKLYLLSTDGNMLPIISKHMARIALFLQSKTDIFRIYEPKTNMNLAMEK